MPKRGGYANGIQNATLAKIDEAGEKLQNIGSSVENTANLLFHFAVCVLQ